MKEQVKLDLFDILVLWIVMVSLFSVALLTMHQFKSLYALVVGTAAVFGIVAVVYRGNVRLYFAPRIYWLLAILLLALLYRAQPFLWVMGGQDQGLYVNISEQYEKYGSPFVVDRVRASLSDKAKLIFDNTQHYLDSFHGYNSYPTIDIEAMKKQGVNNENVKHNNVFAMHTPAVFLKDMSNSEYVFQFYPLHSLWMSISSILFGSDKRVYSAVVFSLLSIISFYRLGFELSKDSSVAGMLIATMLACNPLHIFFSKFPVSEMVALFFSVTGFYYLALYYNECRKSFIRIDYLIISALLFFCMFLTRITGFLYIPLFYILLISILISDNKNEKSEKCLINYCLVVMLLYAISIMFGLQYSYPYSMHTYNNFFGWILGPNWMIFVAAFMLIAMIIVIWMKKGIYNKVLNRYATHDKLTTFVLMSSIGAVGVALIKYIIDIYIQQSLSKLFAYTLVAIIAYVSPFCFSFVPMAIKKHGIMNNTFHLILVVFWSFFFCMMVMTVKIVKYQFYYARYLLSEVVPYAMLVVAMYWAWGLEKGKGSRNLARVMMTCTCVYFLYFSSFQLQGVEADGAAQALQRVKGEITSNDLLMLGFDDLRLQTSFSYFYDMNTYRVDKPQAVDDVIYAELKNNFNRLFLITKSSVIDRSLKLIAEIPYREGEYEHANHIPMRFSYTNQCTLYLYEIDKTLDTKSVYNSFLQNKIWLGKS